jgi:glycosyltransferase involved in cell wall biosynthesis
MVQLARETGVSDAVHFEPVTANVVPWLRKMDIFVLPSREEALSNAIIEAMACGTCVVASDVGGNPELTGTNGERGCLFPVGDSAQLASQLIELAGNPEKRRALAREARTWVATNLSLAVSAARMGEIYFRRLGL